MALDPARVIEELQDLERLTGGPNGAQRVCWTPVWEQSRAWLHEKIAALPVDIDRDEAGNLWATLCGASSRTVLLGGHFDSVEDGGWLDGCLNVVAALEVLRRLCEEGTPAVTVALVDWADEEGFRFGKSLWGSSCASGTMDPNAFRVLRDRGGIPLPEALAAHGVDIDRALGAQSRFRDVAAYLELHIEQGPVLESIDHPLGAVLGTFGVERHVVTFIGQRAHVGATPMAMRHDPVAGMARFALEGREIALRHGGVTTIGVLEAPGGIPTAVPAEVRMTFDQRHLEQETLNEMLRQARAASERIASEERLEVGWSVQWRIPARPFDARLVDFCDEAILETVGRSHRMPSGALHDAAEMAGAGIPTVMMFVQSLRGLSHNKEEDTLPDHIAASVRALDVLVSKTNAYVAQAVVETADSTFRGSGPSEEL